MTDFESEIPVSLPEDLQEKIEQLDSIFVMHRRFQVAYKDIESSRVIATAREKPRPLFVVGESGSGKTTLAKKIQRAHKHRIERVDEVMKRPVVYFKLKADPSAKSVMVELKKQFFEGEFRFKGTASELLDDCVSLIKKCKVELIMVDETNELTEGRRDSTQMKAANQLKQLAERAGVLVVFFGTKDATLLLSTNQQLERRAKEIIDFSSLDPGDARDLAEFQEIVREIEKQLPFTRKSNLSEDRTARSILLASGGVIGRSIEFIQEAAELAIVNGHNRITRGDLQEASERFVTSKDKRMGQLF